MDIHEYQRQRCKGYISSWIARPSRPLTTVVKTVATIARRHSISSVELAEGVREIRDLSVNPFGPERLERFRQIVAALRQRGVL